MKLKPLALVMLKTVVLAATYSVAGAGVLLPLMPAAHAQDRSEPPTGQSFQRDPYTTSDYGGVGLLQTPTARMNSEGHLTLGYYDTDDYRRTSITLQLFDWMEATARYTDLRYSFYSRDPEFSGDQTLKDKGFDLKFRALKESKWLPEVAIGLRDLGGTGLFGGEYIVGSKAWHTENLGTFDFHLGLGFGYLGRRDNSYNPFCEITDEFCGRPRGTTPGGGDIEWEKMFKGPAATFGGVEWRTPIQGLRLKAEYDPNDYQSERLPAPIDPENPRQIVQDSFWNFGAEYAYNNLINLKLGYQRGNTMTFGFSLRYNLATAYQVKTEPPLRDAKRSSAQGFSDVDLNRLSQALLNETGFAVKAVEHDNNEAVQQERVTLYAEQTRYRDREEAVEKAARILSNELPESVTRYEIAEIKDGLGIVQYNVNAPFYKSAARGERFYREEDDAFTLSNVRVARGSTTGQTTPTGGVGSSATETSGVTRGRTTGYQATRTKAGYSITPNLSQSFGGAEDFYIYQLAMMGEGYYHFTPNLRVSGTVGVNIVNNYDEFNFLVDDLENPLPRVRTRIREYYDNQDLWLQNLQLVYTDQASDSVYYALYGGYLERIFGGIGGEILYRPLNSRFAFGVDLNWAKQREPDNSFGFEDYDVLTGHASIYWQPEFLPQSLIKLQAGRFLAGDEGVQVDFSHQFDSGVRAGAYAAFTNVSREEYGEGGFTKGFYISIPFDLFTVRNTLARGRIGWQPITRDGGQMLNRSINLYETTEARGYKAGQN
ncbi:YjbH domain-containing protein [Pseudidiomarina aquimaris]|uniref:YjbH domain-containing protein n=1 Tax=Pseudidiomarina aquimaris TaxID=641841 RepID=A0A432XD14_9GAMM|nr:YjbH domain-containing protein [Pseudidiomarina aquimaris]RUO46628.1 YjbH domain-containing protein [Pseudidiomarina aquimaris]